MDDDEEVVLEREDDALPQPLEGAHALAGELGDGGAHRLQHEGARDADGGERLAEHARREAVEVDQDVGQLRHANPLTAGSPPR